MNVSPSIAPAVEEPKKLRSISVAEASKHITKNDCRAIVEHVTKFTLNHPARKKGMMIWKRSTC